MAVYKKTISYEIEDIYLWGCGACGQTYQTEEGAEECCKPEIDEVIGYRCPNCEKVSTSKKEILGCCSKEVLICVSCRKEVEADGECCPDLFHDKDVQK